MKDVIHDITERRSPINIVVRCSCGWSRTFTRKQNALARAAKVRAAVDAHNREIEANAAAGRHVFKAFRIDHDGVTYRWNVDEMIAAAKAGAFGEPQRFPVAGLGPANWDDDNLSRSRVDALKADPERLAEPILIVASPPGSPHPLLCICDGNHRIVALQEMAAEHFEAFIVPWEMQEIFRVDGINTA
jgi:hypothetical protein